MPKVQFYEAHKELVGVAPKPEPAINNLPDWWRLQPPFMNDGSIVNGTYHTTIKKCQAMFDSMSSGYIFKAPVDIYIDATGPQIQMQVPAALQEFSHHILSAHPREQMSNFPIDTNVHINYVARIHTCWVMKTDPGYSTLFVPPALRDDAPISVLQAIVDTDKFLNDGHMSFFVKKGFKGVIKQGTPIIQAIPFKRENWQSEFKEFDGKMIAQQRKIVRSTFLNGYKMKYWTRKVYK